MIFLTQKHQLNQKDRQFVLRRIRENWNSHVLLVGLKNSTADMGGSFQFLKMLNRDSPYYSAIQLLVSTQGK